MTDIEKRANYIASADGCVGLARQHIIEACVKIATEQQEIDAINAIRLIQEQKELSLALIGKQQATDINKAWQWMVDWAFENAPHEVFDELMSSREEYVKAMEEQ